MVDLNGWTPAHIAARKGSARALKVLVSAMRNVDARNEGNATALHCAAEHGQVQCIEVLLSAKANVHAVDKGGATPLLRAAEAGHVGAVTELLVVGRAVVDEASSRGKTPLYYAARAGHVDVVKVLLRYGASPDSVTENRRTPMHAAVDMHRIPVIRLLAAEKARRAKSSSPSSRSSSSLHARRPEPPILLAARNGSKQVLCELLSTGANVNERRDDGSTALIEAAKAGHAECVDLLLASEADVLLRDYSRKSALDWALEQLHPNSIVVRELKQAVEAKQHALEVMRMAMFEGAIM